MVIVLLLREYKYKTHLMGRHRSPPHRTIHHSRSLTLRSNRPPLQSRPVVAGNAHNNNLG